ncbi:MAG: septum formation protein Maf [Sphingomonadaceae bacterium]|nr:septum formation protein Maf [Sphingomonadaceae bacterium]
MRLILASQSAARCAMLAAAEVPHEAMASGVDEEAAKASLSAEGLSPRDLADALAELKAVKLSARFPDAMVLGCDQVAAIDEEALGKPGDREAASAQLGKLRGATHAQHSAAVIAEGGRPVWRHVDTAKLTMRDFSDGFLEEYLDAEWPTIGGCAGGYRLEGRGVQLFARIEGSHFTILGLPLLPLLDYLRERGVIVA